MKMLMENWNRFINEEESRVLNENLGKVLDKFHWQDLLDRVHDGKSKIMARDWKRRSRQPATEEDIAAVRGWLSSNGYEDSNVFDGKDPSWKTQASDKDFIIWGLVTSDDFNYHTMKSGDKPINLVFIRSAAKNEDPIYAYVRY